MAQENNQVQKSGKKRSYYLLKGSEYSIIILRCHCITEKNQIVLKCKWKIRLYTEKTFISMDISSFEKNVL